MAWYRDRDGKYDVYERVLSRGKMRPKYMGTFPNARLRDAKMRALEEDKAMNRHHLVDYDATLWKYCDKYLEAPVNREPGTLWLIGNAVKHIKQFFPEATRLQDITEDDVEDFIKWFALPVHTETYHRKSYNHTTAHMQMRNFKSILQYAIEKKVIQSNPAKAPLAKFGKPKKRQIRYTQEHLERFYDACLRLPMKRPGRNLELWKIAKTLYATGVRRAELLNMEKEHMITEFAIEIVNPSTKRKSAAQNATKSEEPYIVDLNDEIAPFFHEVQSGRIFPGWTKNSFSHEFKRAAKLAGFPETIPHGMRHTFAKDLLQSGKVSLPEVQGRLNHKDIQSTMVYSKWAKNQRSRESVNALIRPQILKVV